jgi:hypothetical protein
MAWYLYLAAVAVAICLHLWLGKRPVSGRRLVEVVLLYLLVFYAGVGGLMGFLGHTFKPQEIARQIGWLSNPFQSEVAMANLAFGVLGLMCIWQRQGFRTATGIGFAIFLLGCASVHLQDMTRHGNLAPYNAGPVLWFNDLAIPVVVLLLLLVRRHLAVTQAGTPASNQ